MPKYFPLLIALLLSGLHSKCQDEDKFIHTREGAQLGAKKFLVMGCQQGYGAPAENQLIKQICECQVNLLDRRYTNKQVKAYQKKYKSRAIFMLMNEDSSLQQQTKQCYEGTNNIALLTLPAYRQSFVGKCVDNLRLQTDKPLNDTLARLFCSCAADVLEKRKISLEKFDDLSDPNSFLYNEIAYKCGSPFLEPSDLAKDWKAINRKDIIGPDIDSVTVISVMGMHKVKIKIGTQTKIWLLDSGASDLLISDEFEKTLKSEGVINQLNYIGEGHYGLADNRQITCKRYKIDNVRIGHLVINNIILATSKETKEFLVGKSLLNKFSQWILDNKNNLLILRK